MKTTTTLSLLLTLSVVLNIIFWWKDRPTETECYVTPGYQAPRILTTEEASAYAAEYRESLVDPEIITGGVITRSAFDAMMCLKDCNAIAYSFALDSKGTNGPGDKGVFVILSGAKVVYDDEKKEITSVDKIGSPLYYTRNWCPPSCLPW